MPGIAGMLLLCLGIYCGFREYIKVFKENMKLFRNISAGFRNM
jgi:hypothetical protein